MAIMVCLLIAGKDQSFLLYFLIFHFRSIVTKFVVLCVCEKSHFYDNSELAQGLVRPKNSRKVGNNNGHTIWCIGERNSVKMPQLNDRIYQDIYILKSIALALLDILTA